ncbi:metallophosphoesterase family protein [Clostridium oryzae]|uniref:Phosphodiesterase n=1 Tax=Clostridium oryzae TaxID=1450648 RepID=A0A1V4IM00_9CLOT|nr:metallophosphoesterase family protein [Clostridium oryzae]OPJ61058.1 phosphodiesterase [Clostridium oryzae]
MGNINRIAVVADIHANMHAFKMFIDYLNARPDIGTVLNLGDFLQLGPNPNEVFDIVMNDKRFINILGNNEIELFEDIDDEENNDRYKHKTWTKDTIGNDRINKLAQIPRSKCVEVWGKKFMLIHTVVEQYVDLDELKNCEYVFMGHTHQQTFGSYWKERKVMNPGSIGYNPNGIINFAIIEFDGDIMNFIFKTMKYNPQLLKKDLVENEVPGTKGIVRYLVDGD